MTKPEIIMMKDEEGRCYFEVGSLIAWFRCMDGTAKPLGILMADTLKEMQYKATHNPDRVMTETEYKRYRDSN